MPVLRSPSNDPRRCGYALSADRVAAPGSHLRNSGLHLCACACRRWWASSPAPRRLALSGRCKLSKLPGSCREARPSPEWEGPDLLRSPTRVLYARGGETKPYLAHVGLFGYDSARHALPRPGGQGPRDPREGSAGDLPVYCLEHLASTAQIPPAHLADLAAFVRNLRAYGACLTQFGGTCSSGGHATARLLVSGRSSQEARRVS